MGYLTMQDPEELRWASLQSKIEKLVFLYRKLQDDIRHLDSENILLREKVRDQESLIVELSSGLKTFSAQKAEEAEERAERERLEQMVRDIDRCLELLGKQTEVKPS
jgi:hypothetical protein